LTENRKIFPPTHLASSLGEFMEFMEKLYRSCN